jgi:sugar phosphate isomerase/epimerase
MLESYGLTAVSFSAHADVSTDSGLAAFISRLRLAADLGISIIITSSLPLDRLGWKVEARFCSTLVELADLGDRLGVMICLETVGFQMDAAQQCLALLRRLDHPNRRINYDPAARIYCFGREPGAGRRESKPEDDVTCLANQLGHVHLNNKASPVRDRWDFRPVGEGILDWEPILAALDRVGYAGPASIEIGWETPPDSIDVVDDAVRRSLRHVRRWFRERDCDPVAPLRR